MIASLQRETTERTCVDAYGLAKFVCKHEFIATLYTLSDVLPPLAQLSRAFQTKDIDFSIVQPLVVATKTTIRELIDYPGEHFRSLPGVFRKLNAEFDVTVPTRQQMEQYTENVYDKYLSTLLEHLEYRFPDVKIIEAFSVFDVTAIPTDPVKRQEYGKEYLDVLNAQYGPHVITPESLKAEYPLFVNAIRADERLCTSTTREIMLLLISNSALQAMFPNLAKVAAIGLLLPMSIADCERIFNPPTRKTDLRNRLSNQILNCLILISIEGPSPTDFPYDEACDIWSGWRNRRISVSS